MTNFNHQPPTSSEAEHVVSPTSTGQYAVSETVSLDPGNTYSVPNIPEGILSGEEFQAWANEQGYGNGKRGTYRSESSFLYVKGCHRLENEEDVKPALEAIRDMTAKGMLHPATQWGAFRSDSDYQLFAVSPKLHAWSLDEERNGKEMQRLDKPYSDENSARLEWIRRLDPEANVIEVRPELKHKDMPPSYDDFDDFDLSFYTPAPYDEIQSSNPLAATINLYEASHSDNWGWDENGNLYPVDVEVIRISGTREMNAVRQWQANRQSGDSAAI